MGYAPHRQACRRRTVNFAYHASQNGAESFAISAVGNDELGTELLSDAHKAGINTLVQTNEYPTGTVDVALTNGIPEYTIVENVAWDHIKLTDELVEAVSKADAVCFGTLGLRSPNPTTPSSNCSSTPRKAL